MLYHNDQTLIEGENSVFGFAALSVMGDRTDQQDSFGYKLKQDAGLLVVCDGMGGHEGGRLASEIAVENFLAAYAQHRSVEGQTEMLIDTAKEVDGAICQLRNESGNLLKAGSTLVSIIVDRNKLMWCSVGDSRAYLWRNGEMVQLTQDHNYNTVLVEKMRAGIIDKACFERENARGEALISFLGIGNLALVDYSETPVDLIKEDKIMIMSDGLYKLVSDEEIARILDNFRNIGEAVWALEMKARKNAKSGGKSRDNMTVALLKIK